MREVALVERYGAARRVAVTDQGDRRALQRTTVKPPKEVPEVVALMEDEALNVPDVDQFGAAVVPIQPTDRVVFLMRSVGVREEPVPVPGLLQKVEVQGSSQEEVLKEQVECCIHGRVHDKNEGVVGRPPEPHTGKCAEPLSGNSKVERAVLHDGDGDDSLE